MTPFFVMVFDLISSFTNEKKSQVRKKSGPAKEVLGVKFPLLLFTASLPEKGQRVSLTPHPYPSW